ncbi:MAG: hypothetical protein HY000_24030 [Planctomycetes bacterium]|nr:hypothetical protein [Planctomycetota bacterium]
MSKFGAGVRFLYLACLSRPAADRTLYRAIRRNRPRSILEIGVGAAVRARRMIDLARRCSPGETIHYTGIDLFEAREPTAPPGLSLKTVYRQLKATPARIRLTPGDPLSALMRVANDLLGTDLVVISAGLDEQSLSGAWRYVPRILHAGSQVYLQRGASPDEGRFELITGAELNRLAAVHSLRRAA